VKFVQRRRGQIAIEHDHVGVFACLERAASGLYTATSEPMTAASDIVTVD